MLPSAPDSEDGLPQVFIDFKRKCETGKATPLTSFPLSKADYTRLHDKIQATFRRFDYDPQLERISIRMPPVLHDLFIREFGLAVLDAVREVGRQNKLVPLPRASTTLWHLRKIAHQYIYHTDEDIKMVLCFDLNSDKESTISVWKPVFYPDPNSDVPKMEIEQVVQTQACYPFRDADRSPVPGALTLHLHDFAPDTLCQGCRTLPLPISYHDMSDMMAKAERSMELRKRRKDRTPKRITKRRYVETSEDKMGTEDEKRCSQEADNANGKEGGDNGVYKPQES
ncbi:hypothetical protein BFJ65_g15683 [Fusarium oxysporum f. sp. cepae]|uniref:Uncharacterized protein n=1 Tax=Fusarium oxysporum f. sp. cepae TaxID=396571 RepID=A0A3L6MXU6_FUSOX|nr:hypothetical protein BFJ65_g15683 [Fusarium oxysporum f. sp. cepae]